MTSYAKALIFHPLSVFNDWSLSSVWLILKRIFWLVSVSLLISLLALTFSQIKQLAQEISSLNAAKQRLAALSQDNQFLKLTLTQTNGHQVLSQDLIEQLEMEEVVRAHFIEASKKQMAASSLNHRY